MSPRMSAAERREQVIEAAVAEFSRTGFEGTTTAAIAKRVGVSQPYLFRLFPTKHALFTAAADRCFGAIEQRMRDAVGGRHGRAAIEAMIDAYQEILTKEQTLLRLQLQIYAAAVDDAEIRAVGHVRFAALWRLFGELSGVDPDEIMQFVARGMLGNVLQAFGVPFPPGRRLDGRWLADWARDAERP
ncbi:TetR/AcrR family transcriptional regulator [Actinomadura rayongensis]|uniref:TetR family transcriptional regulator n=1 Tax=Actinomadura rayongensis TaxID=1429076 RepID=A0A6I4W2A3_9ACTN|nr:TetR/AcrR family transcriptional regulator [Actinomadura rayongensis]MXQ62595.1 TetR family transcriptional regulator [Actinomadura rayongensis]